LAAKLLEECEALGIWLVPKKLLRKRPSIGCVAAIAVDRFRAEFI
jgi:hypothetical protein